MTSLSRKKRQTILQPVLTLVSILGAAAVGSAQHATVPASGTASTGYGSQQAYYSVPAEQSSSQGVVIQVQGLSDNIRLKRGSGLASGDDSDYYFKVESKPPTRDRLFSLGSEAYFLGNIEREFKQQDPGQIFLLPAPIDTFDGPNEPTLGPLWFQNRVSGTGRDSSDRRGEFRVQDGRGVFPVGAKPEAAIMNQTVGSNDMIVSLDMVLGSGDSSMGLVFRAKDPNIWIDDVDQIKANSFYYATATTSSITLGIRDEGKDKVLSSVTVDSKTAFKLSAAIYGDDIVVYRDGQEVLRFKDDTLEGTFVGIIGLISKGEPSSFDFFDAVRYGGPFNPRTFAASASIFRGPNVHYRPLYFEQVALERWGQSYGNIPQPFIAQAMFYIDLIFIPYSIGKNPPWVCHSGQCLPKPGDIVLPYKLLLPYPDAHGILLQTSAMGLWFSLIP